ncbi:hypothetical protein GCM10018787_21480 [Streptomyces thermodiastaticus]|nr:hypothetical protein GCM10018787_21480 [Streptomyces thermodiastaticus]
MTGLVQPHQTSGEDRLARWKRESAVAEWLLAAAEDPRSARAQWAAQDVALLVCGRQFTAVRLPGELVRAAAGGEDQDENDLNAFLGRALEGGPVTRDRSADHYFALVPVTTEWPESNPVFPAVEHLHRGWYLGVPAVDRTKPYGRAYWSVPMRTPGCLCDPLLVRSLVRRGEAHHQALESPGAGR